MQVINIDIGDKADAWNVFIHETQIKSDVFCFLDGDYEMLPDSYNALEKCIEHHQSYTPAQSTQGASPADGD